MGCGQKRGCCDTFSILKFHRPTEVNPCIFPILACYGLWTKEKLLGWQPSWMEVLLFISRSLWLSCCQICYSVPWCEISRLYSVVIVISSSVWKSFWILMDCASCVCKHFVIKNWNFEMPVWQIDLVFFTLQVMEDWLIFCLCFDLFSCTRIVDLV